MLVVIFVTIIIAIVAAVYSPLIVGFMVLLVGVSLFIYKRKEYKFLFWLSVWFFIFFIYTFSLIQIKEVSLKEASNSTKEVRLEGKVTKTYSYGFLAKIIKDKTFSGKEIIVYKESPDLVVGDIVKVDGKLTSETGSSRLDLLTRPFATVFPRQIIKIKDSKLAWIFDIKTRIIINVKQQLPEYYANFLIGLLIGVNGIDLDSDLQDVFLNLGLLHMLVVSGAQVALLTSVLLKLLVVFKLPKTANFLIVLFFNCIFLLFVGGDISVLRAVIMMQITIFLNYDNRSKTALQVLALTGIIMLIFSPGMLFSLSFILSFCATFAVVEISPRIQKMFEDNDCIPEFLKDPLGVSLGPILTTAPIIFLINGRFDVLALFANMIFAPIVEVVVIVGFFGMLLSVTCTLLSVPVLKFTFGLLVIMKTVADILYSFPGRSLYFRHTFVINLFVYYLFFFALFYRKEVFRKYWSSWLTILIIVVLINFWFISQKPEREIFFYNKKNWFSVLYINKDKTVMLVSAEDKENQKKVLRRTLTQPSVIVNLQAIEDKGKMVAMKGNSSLAIGGIHINKMEDIIVFQDDEVKVTIIVHGVPVNKVDGILYLPNNKKVNNKLLASGADLILLPCKDSKGQVVSSKRGVVGIFKNRGKYHIYRAI